MIDYKIKTACIEDVFIHLNWCKDDFIPNLAKTVDILSYSKKIVSNSITFEAWSDKKMVGLVAAYFNNESNKSEVYITNVSVLNENSGQGVASKLLERCFKYANENQFEYILLEVNRHNNKAIKLYERFDFDIIEYKENSTILMKKKIL